MLISPDGPETIMGTAPRMRAFEVVAVFEIGMSEYDSSVIYMGLEDAQEYFMSEDGVTAIDLMVDDPDAIDARVAALYRPGRAGACASSPGSAPTRPSSARSRWSATSCS
jgi:ABC-type lipoprotein release transport system permease subunit